MSTLTVCVDANVKAQAQKNTKKEGVTLTFVVNQALKAYNSGDLRFGLLDPGDEITAAFNVSTKEGKKACLDSFKALAK